MNRCELSVWIMVFLSGCTSCALATRRSEFPERFRQGVSGMCSDHHVAIPMFVEQQVSEYEHTAEKKTDSLGLTGSNQIRCGPKTSQIQETAPSLSSTQPIRRV